MDLFVRIISWLRHGLHLLYKSLKNIYSRFFLNVHAILQKTIFGSDVHAILKKELFGYNIILDLGCGRHSLLAYSNVLSSVNCSIGVDLFDPYLLETRRKRIHSQYVKADVRRIEFKPKSLDAVVALDLLEHLTKEEGVDLVNRMEKWSREKVIIFTPNGYLQQDEYDENPLQEHTCGWSVEELQGLGFKVFGINGWKSLRGYKSSLKYKPSCLWEMVSSVSQTITYRYPRQAFQLLAVKQIKEVDQK